jgi:hypothetical protein
MLRPYGLGLRHIFAAQKRHITPERMCKVKDEVEMWRRRSLATIFRMKNTAISGKDRDRGDTARNVG